MLSIWWCMVRCKAIGLIVFNERYVYCDRHFLYEKPKPWKTDTKNRLKPNRNGNNGTVTAIRFTISFIKTRNKHTCKKHTKIKAIVTQRRTQRKQTASQNSEPKVRAFAWLSASGRPAFYRSGYILVICFLSVTESRTRMVGQGVFWRKHVG